jgi:hypothetical protein
MVLRGARAMTRMAMTSADVPVHQIDQLVVHRFRIRVPFADRRRGAVAKVISHELPAHTAQRLVNRRNLRHDISAVPFLFHHALKPPHLTLDSTQPLQIPVLDVRIDLRRAP